ncbi:MAG: YbaN family protein [Treponema sp.]
MKIKKIVLITIGCVSLGLGCVGIALPILPTTPFFLLTLVCFTNSSERLHDWFIGTKLYKKHLEAFVQKRGMTAAAKLSVIIAFTLVMAFGFIMMKKTPVGRAALAVVWAVHIVYFVFIVKTLRKKIDTAEGGTEKTTAAGKDL